MRSLFVYYLNVSPDSLRKTMRGLHEPSLEAGYDFQLRDAEGVWGLAYITPKLTDIEADEWNEISKALGGNPSAVLVVDVTGSRRGVDEATEFASQALVYDDSVAQDDYSSFLWDIKNIYEVNDGRRFFVGIAAK